MFSDLPLETFFPVQVKGGRYWLHLGAI